MGKFTPKVNRFSDLLRKYQAWLLDEQTAWHESFPKHGALANACFRVVVGRGRWGERTPDGRAVTIRVSHLAAAGNCSNSSITRGLAVVQEESGGYGWGEGFHEESPAIPAQEQEAVWLVSWLVPPPDGIEALLEGFDLAVEDRSECTVHSRRQKKVVSNAPCTSVSTSPSSSSKTKGKAMTMAMVDGDGLAEGGKEGERKKPAMLEKQEDLRARLMAEPCNLDCGGATEAARAVPPVEIQPLLAVDDAFWEREVKDASQGARPRRGVSEADRHKALLMSRVRNPRLRRELIQRAKKALGGGETPAGASGDYAMGVAIKAWKGRVAAIPAEGHVARLGCLDAEAEAWGVVQRVFAESYPQAWSDLEAQIAAEVSEKGGSDLVQRRERARMCRQRLTPIVEAIEKRLTEAA
jgi:predicted metal-dependent hydrolase